MDTGEAHSPPEGTPGARLRAYVNAHWGRRQGGIRGLAARMSTTAETMYEWFRDDREPSLAHLRALAEAFGVSRWEVLGAMDGDLPEAPFDERTWARMEARVEAMLDARLGPRRPELVRGPR